ncbi:sensor histidine kinase, partial [Klebsiella oxytoca]
LSRLEYGILSLQPEEQDISEVLLALRRQYLPSAAQKQIQLLLEPTSGLAIFDRKWTIEAIGNLIDNAIKYTP